MTHWYSLLLQEADIDEDEEANMVADWDQDAATKAYEEQVRAAEEEERKRAEAEAAWLEQQLALNLPEVVAPKRGKVGRPRKGQGQQDLLPTQSEPTEAIKEVPKAPKILVYPWDIQEDFVLTAVVLILIASGETKEDFIWSTASGALAAGCASSETSATDVVLSRKGKLRTTEACRNRFQQLQLAYFAAKSMGANDIMASEQYLQKLVAPAIKGLDKNLKEAEKAKGPARTAVSTILKALDARQDSKISNTLAIELHAIRLGTSRWSALLDRPVDTSVSLSIPDVTGIVQIVKARCGEEEAARIETKLAAVIQAAKLESGCLMASQPATANHHHRQSVI